MEVALRLFAERGYDGVGVQELAAEAGVTKPSLYHHFSHKLGLLTAALEAPNALLIEALGSAAEYRGNLGQCLDDVVALYFEAAQRSPDSYRLSQALLFLPPGHEGHVLAAEHLSAQLRRLEGLFRAATQDHGNMRGRHSRYALTFLGVVNSHAGLVLDGSLKPAASVRQALVHQFSHGIYS